MHSKIFQITETRVDRDNYLNEDTLEQGDGHYYDYCSEIDEEERKFHIVNGNQKCSDFGNSECSSFGIKTTVFLASVVQ